jgi:hypothetical protein
MPDEKELNFFSDHFEKGLEWYSRFFSGSDEGSFLAVGEFSPVYLCAPPVPERIKQSLGDCRLVAILRNPVDRAFSEWRFRAQKRCETRSFEKFLEEDRDILEISRYGKQIERYLGFFDSESMLILVFERATSDPETALASCASFLGIDPGGFGGGIPRGERVNRSFMPRHTRLYNLAYRLNGWLRAVGFGGLARSARRLGAERVFGRGRELPPIDPATRERLTDLLHPDVERFERLTGISVPEWRESRE